MRKLSLLLVYLIFFPTMAASVPLVDNNNGIWRDNYTDPVGIASSSNIEVDNGSVSLTACDGSVASGEYTTTLIKPSSFSAWGTLTAGGVFAANTLNIEVRQPGGGVLLSGAGPQLDLSSLNPVANPELEVRIVMTYAANTPCPAVTDLEVTWSPRSILLLEKSAPVTVQAGEVITYQLRVSVNWVTAQGLVVWDPLPSSAAGTLIYPTEPSPTPYPGQNDDPDFQSATQGGQYTDTSITVNGITIPANSVYWEIDPAEEGLTLNLSYSIKTLNGTLDNTLVNNTAFADAANADAVQTTASQTAIRSAPAPRIEKSGGAGILTIGGQNQTQVGSTIQFILSDPQGLPDANDYAPIGRETMYNSVVWDDVSNLCAQLTSVNCTTGAGFNNISGSGSFNPNFSPPDGSATIPAIVWPARTLTPGAGFYETFEVDVIGPVDGATLINTVHLDSDQTDVVSDRLTVQVGIDDIPPDGLFAKGDGLNGSLSINAVINDNSSLFASYDGQYKYGLGVFNDGASSVHDIVMLDRIPDDVTFVSASLPVAANGQIFYSTDLTFTDPSDPPPIDVDQAPGDLDEVGNTFWQTTLPANPASVTWVAFYIPQVSSIWFPPAAPVTQAIGEIIVATGPEQCEASNIDNRGVFRAYRYTPLNGGSPLPIPEGPLEGLDDELTQVKPKIAEFNLQPSAVSLTPNPFEPPMQLDYNLSISNIDSPTSDTATDIRVELNWNQIPIDGVLAYPSFVSVTGGTLETLDPANGRLVLNIGTLAPGESTNVNLILSAPEGIAEGSTVVVNGTVSGADNLCDAPTFSLSSVAAGVVGNPRVQVLKNDVVNLIEPGDEYDYSLTYNNLGPAPSTGTYLVDQLPKEVVFINANLPNGEQLYCSAPPLDSNLPPTLSTVDRLDASSIANYFSLGIETSPGSGIWTCPQGEQTSWIALFVDDQTLSPPQLPVNSPARTATFTVRNDESRIGGDPTGSSVGTLIFNDVGVFSDQLLQSIANEVITTVSEQPGIEVRKTGPSVTAAGARFSWEIEYFNSSGADDTVVTIVDTLPTDVSFVSATHEWNQDTLANDPSLLTGEQPISPTVNGSELTFAIAPAYRGGNLATTEGGTITVTVDASDALSSGQLLTNIVCGSAENDLGTTPEVCAEAIVEVVNAELFLRKQVDNPAPRSGDTINYTLILSNLGRLNAEDVVIEDVLPVGLSYVGPTQILSPSGYTLGEPAQADQILRWTDLTHTETGIPGVLPAQSGDIFISYAVQVDASVAPGTTLQNFAEVTTTSPEDGDFPNEDDETVRTPHPDPTVNKTGPALADPGSTVSWTVQYRNNNNEDASGVYLIDSLPSFDADADTDVTFISTSANGPGTVDIYYNATAGAAPAFDITNPISNDWSATPTAPVNHIAYAVGDLSRLAGPFSITITVQLTDPVSGEELPSGAELTNNVRIFSSTVDDDPSNNQDDDTVHTPGLDMAITKTGSSEGGFPGLPPGADLVYTIDYENTGPITAWGVRIVDTLPSELTLVEPQHNFVQVNLQDEFGNNCTPVDASGNPLSGAVVVDFEASGQTLTWWLGGNPGYRSVGIPPGCGGTFEVFTRINADVADSTSIDNTVTLFTDRQNPTDPPEPFLGNNTDDSQVTVYRTDLMVLKSVVDVPTDSEQFTDSGNILEYTIEYANIGNISAEDVIISEIIPEGARFVSIDPPANSSVQFLPDADDPTEFNILFNDSLPAPSTYFEQSQYFDLIGNDITNLTDDTTPFVPWNGTSGAQFGGDANPSVKLFPFDADGDGDLDVFSSNGLLYLNQTSEGVTGQFTSESICTTDPNSRYVTYAVFDADGDGDIDIICTTASGKELFLNQGGNQGGVEGAFLPDPANPVFGSSVPPFTFSAGLLAFDADNDGDLDVIVSGTELYFNQGGLQGGVEGEFAVDASNPSAGVDSSFTGSQFVAEDIDNDGDQDLILFNAGFAIPLAEAYLNLGGIQGGTLGQFFGSFPIGGAASFFLSQDYAVFDANGDGNVDVVLTEGDFGVTNTQLYLGDGMGNFAAPQTLPVTGVAGALTATDADNDGDQDLLILTQAGGVLLLNDGNGVFSPWDDDAGFLSGVPGFSPSPGIPSGSLVAFDADGDGRVDFADAGAFLNGSFIVGIDRLFLNNLGTSACLVLDAATPITLAPDNQQTIALAVADFNTDGNLDIVNGNPVWQERTPPEINRYHVGNGDGTFTEVPISGLIDYAFPVGGGSNGDGPGENIVTQAMTVADVNNDGFPDVLVANQTVGDQVRFNELYLNDGAGNFIVSSQFNDVNYDPSAPAATIGRETFDIEAADLNGDGNPDVLVANKIDNGGGAGNENQLFFGNGDGTFQPGVFAFNGPLPLPTEPRETYDIEVADFDLDGDQDVLLINGATNNVSGSNPLPTELYLNDGLANFTRVDDVLGKSYIMFSFPSDAALVADFNADGIPDVAVTDDINTDAFLGNGDGTFQLSTEFGHGSRSIAAGDVTGDGIVDLVTVSGVSNYIYPGNGDGTFGVPVLTLQQSDLAQTVEIADFNNNGIADILIGRRDGSTGPVHDNHLYLDYMLAADGTMTSPLIEPVALYPNSGDLLAWKNLIVDVEIPDQTAITYDVLDSSGDPITGFMGLEAPDGILSLAGLDVATYPAIQVRATLSQTSSLGNTPKFCGWQTTFQMSRNPSFTFRVRVDDPVIGLSQIDNSVAISTATPETRSDNNADEDTIQLILADVFIEKSVDQAATVPGSTLEYTLDYGNNGPQTALNVVVSDTLPAGVTFGAFVGAPPCTQNSGVINCTVGDLNVGAGGQIVFTVTVNAGTENTTLINPSIIATDTNETDYSNNDDPAETVVLPVGATLANVFIEKDGPAVAQLGGLIIYTLNYGSSSGDAIGPADNVIVEDTLPADCAYDADNTNPAPTSVNGSILTWTIGTLQPGETGTITVACQVAANQDLISTQLRNTTQIRTDTPEVTTADNNDDHPTVVTLEPASISGYVWRDDNTNVDFDESGSNGIEGVIITLMGTDIFGNTITQTTVTGLDGSYRFTDLPPGTYTVTETQPVEYASTGSSVGSIVGNSVGTSASPDQITSIVLQAGDAGINYNFGEALGALGDLVWLDENGNGQQDTGEPGIVGVVVTLLDGNGMELAQTVTDDDGNYLFTNLPPGDYAIRVAVPAQYSVTTPNTGADTGDSDIDNTGLSQSVTLGLGELYPDLDAGLILGQGFDFGDLPPGYPFVTGPDAARHQVLSVNNPSLGNQPDTEVDGQPSANADADTEEDGVQFGPLSPGEQGSILVTVNNPGGDPVFLNAWIDWNGDGDFDDPNEQIATALEVTQGGQIVLPVDVPLDANTNQMLGARFRLSSEANLGVSGLAPDGEIEDYLIGLTPTSGPPGGGGSPPANIPVLGLWAQALFALLLGFMVHFRTRLSSRKKTL